jgi:branched-chain amino acid transport system ATP-binding protein
LARGRVLALLGSNGAGKTTIARVCSGLIMPTAGKVLFQGDDVTGQRAFKYARRGIIHAPEGRSVFASLTVAENLELTFRRSRGRDGVKEGLDEAFTMFPRLRDRRHQVAGTLSGGEQRMLSLARVIVERPRLLIADELSLGLAPIVVDEVYRTLEQIREAGTTLLIVEQHVHHALAIADDAIVLVKGEVAYCGPVSELGDLQSRVLGGGSGEGPIGV